MNNKIYSVWDKIEIVRDLNRKTSLDYIENLFDDFIELHGDRNYKDDKAIVCGLAKFGKENVTVVAQQKGRSTKENIYRNFGMPNPEGYRKARRFVRQAEKFNRPIITFIDTKGAYPGMEAEDRGQRRGHSQFNVFNGKGKGSNNCSDYWRGFKWRGFSDRCS